MLIALKSEISFQSGLLLFTTKKKFLVPKKEWHFPHETPKKIKNPNVSFLRATLPYLLVSLLLIITRIPSLGIKNILLKWGIPFTMAGIEYSFNIFYNPGFLFLKTPPLDLLRI